MKLFEAGYGNFHLVGFSLGAQVSGLIGRKVIQKSQGKFVIPRITGLDPGKLPKSTKTPIAYLNAGDASFVDTIHTETLFFASRISVGNSSFWVNGACSQPICKNSFDISKNQHRLNHWKLIHTISVVGLCSHLMAPKYWCESVRSKGKSPVFIASKCESYGDFRVDNCDNAIKNSMGLFTSQDLNGKFYLETKNASPFSKD